ncbi:MAG: HNH endonuclease signature motif containing protein [bacterium]
MYTQASEIGVDYITIKLTKSRIDKGLLAIPATLRDRFPNNKKRIPILLDDSLTPVLKSFTPYESSSRECRIGGLSEWFLKNAIKDSDEIVIQIFEDGECFRLISERHFLDNVRRIREAVWNSKEEEDAESAVIILAKQLNADRKMIITNEFVQLSQLAVQERKHQKERRIQDKENVPAIIRILLREVYKGHCQLTNFTFIQRSGKPYFEIHHINPDLGSHLKNLLVVCPNIHAQFTYADHEDFFDEAGWLRHVIFNKTKYKAKQFIDETKFSKFEKHVHIE